MKNLILAFLMFSLSTYSAELTVENLMIEIIKNEIKHPKIVLRQAILETGWFKSYNCKKRNNIFGWYNGDYLEFNTWEDCVKYYKRWQDRKYKGGDYFEFLTRIGYASDEDYIWKLKHIKL